MQFVTTTIRNYYRGFAEIFQNIAEILIKVASIKK